jgi:predicted transcriptional regulator of viral defense system
MQSIHTLLSQNDRTLLEDALLSFGRVVTFDQLWSVLRHSCTREYAKRRVALLVKKGWLVRIKKGQYVVITDLSTLGTNDLSEYVIAQSLDASSYISFENALQYHGFFDQSLSTVRSVTTNSVRSHTVQHTEYLFSRIKENLDFGFTEEVMSNSYRVKMAEAEKALLDMLYFKTSAYTVSLVLEKMREYQHRLDGAQLQRYATRFGIGMSRMVGFLLDQANTDTTIVQQYASADKTGYTKLTNQSKTFNAKWRLYYDNHLIA